MSRPMQKMLIIVSIILLLIFGWYLIRKGIFFYFMSHYEPPPVTISANKAKDQNWQTFLSSVGTLTAVNGVNISSEVSGMIKEIHFDSGQPVHQGDLLILLDTSVEQAQLKNYQAQLTLAQITYDRDKILIKKNVIPQSLVDTAYAQLKEAEAHVEEVQARIKQKNITAPFSGKIGIRSVDIGGYVSPGTTMVTLQSLDPLYVQFNLPEQYLPKLYLNQPVDISINLSGAKNNEASVRGFVTAIDAKVDQQTRNIKVQATVPNKDLQLYPGMFALVKIWLKEEKHLVIIPQTAVAYSLYGDSVFVIKNEGKDKNKKPILKVSRVYVHLGERRDSEIAVTDGLKAGELVVTSGQIKLDNGARVAIDNQVEL